MRGRLEISGRSSEVACRPVQSDKRKGEDPCCSVTLPWRSSGIENEDVEKIHVWYIKSITFYM